MTVMAQLRAWAQIEAWQERIPVARARPDWQQRAACLGLGHLMFPGKSSASCDYPPATRVCVGCPVRLSCLAAARDEELPGAATDPNAREPMVFGVRGGLTAPQRLHVYRRLK